MMIRSFTSVLLALAMWPALAPAQDKPKSLQAEVQTAKWAVEWWGPRHAQKVAALKKRAGQVDLLMIGDSITHYWEEPDGKAIWDEYYGARNAFNIGFSGDRTEHVIWRLQNGEVEGISPKLAVLMIGTNNAGHRQEKSEDTAAGVKGILDELAVRLPNTQVLLVAIFPRGVNPDDKLRKLNDGTNKILATYADDKRVFYLDIGSKFLDEQGGLPKDIMPDRLHPNAKGYGIWAAAMEPMIDKLMGTALPAALNPEPRGEWWLKRHEQKLAALGERAGKVDLLMIGDSITHGWEGQKPTWDKYYGKRNAFNIGYSGDRTEHVIWRLQHGEVDGISPKLAVIMIGTNNAGHRKEKPEDTAAGVKGILDELHTRLPETKVLILAVFPRGATPDDKLRKLNDGTNKILATYADNKQIFFLDIGSEFLDEQGNLSKEIMPDRLHPNTRGYEIWAEAMEPSIRMLLGE